MGVLLLAFSPFALAQQIELLYVAAADCGFCRRWEAQMVDIGTFRARFGVENAPAHLRPGMAKAMEAAGQTSLRGTPWFALLVDGGRPA